MISKGASGFDTVNVFMHSSRSKAGRTGEEKGKYIWARM